MTINPLARMGTFALAATNWLRPVESPAKEGSTVSNDSSLVQQPRWTRPFRTLLSIGIVLVLAAVCGPIIWFNYQRGVDNAIRNAHEQMHQFSNHVLVRLQNLFDPPITSIEVASVWEDFTFPPSVEVIRKLPLLRKIALFPAVDGVYVGYPSGEFIHAVNLQNDRWRVALKPPPDAIVAVRIIAVGVHGARQSHWEFFDNEDRLLRQLPLQVTQYDPRSRPWYRAALDRTDLVATAPYSMATTGALGITIAKAHRSDTRIVIGIDVLLDRMSQFLAEQKISPSSAAFILDQYRNPIIHSSPAAMRVLRESKPGAKAGYSDDLIVAAQRANLPEGQSQQLSIGHEKYVMMATALDALRPLRGDKLFIAAPRSELTVEARRGLWQGLQISALVVSIGIAGALLFARWVTHSLEMLTRGVWRLSEFDFETPLSVSSHVKEISALAAAMTMARTTIQTFGLYVPRELLRQVISVGRFTGRTAKREEVTALFSDIRDFTTICEEREPEEVVELLADYFDIFHETIGEFHGNIIQLLGDSVFAMWNVPVADAEHAYHACACALALQEKICVFNSRQRARNLPEFHTRFGIHTGNAVVGNVGAQARLQYTGMGDTVNVASRLEGLNKELNTTILTSAAVKEHCSERMLFRPLGRLRLKGRADVMEVYELLSAAARDHVK